MEQYISKAAVIAEIEKLISNGKLKCQQSQENNDQASYIAWSEHIATCGKIYSFINSLEVKEMDTWHLQEKEDIYDAVKGWDIHTFICIMKDGTIQKFTGCNDEDYEGCITTHIDGVNDNYDDVADIVKWIELT